MDRLTVITAPRRCSPLLQTTPEAVAWVEPMAIDVSLPTRRDFALKDLSLSDFQIGVGQAAAVQRPPSDE